MDDSALQTLLNNLDTSRSSLHGWLHFWTFLVVLGVALEVVFVVKEYIDQSHDFRRGIVHPPERPSTMLFVLGMLGAGLVAMGVAGELSVDVQAGKVETEIRKANELRVALLSKEAGDAKTSAEDAATAASRAKSVADAAVIAAGKAQEKVEAVAKRAEEVDNKVTLTQFLVSARFINDPKALTERLRQFKGQSVILTSYIGDAEGWGLCTAILNIAHSAEMNATDECGRASPTTPLVSPMNVSGPNDDIVLALAGTISRAGMFGVSSGPFGNAPKPSTLVIFVGAKSPFMIGQAQPVSVPTKKQIKKQAAKP